MQSRELYDRVLRCAQSFDIAASAPEDANFRFWSKKSFTIVVPNPVHCPDVKGLTWDGKDVAVTDMYYDILVEAHLEVGHGGRDLTFQAVTKKWSKLPKAIVQA